MAKCSKAENVRIRLGNAGSPMLAPPIASTLSLAVADEANKAVQERDFVETLLSLRGSIPRDIDLEF